MTSATDDRDVTTSTLEQAPQGPGPSGSRGIRLAGVAGVLVLVLIAVLAFTAGRLTATAGATPATDSAAAGFARDMSVHHAQAVDMSMIVRDRTQDEDVRILAYDIALTQQQQIGQMYAWLTLWGLSQSSGAAPMAWIPEGAMTSADGAGMDHASMSSDGTMMGMASRADLTRLAELDGREAEVLFLRLMLTHHHGGVAMAEAVLDLPAPDEVHQLAQAMVNAQNAEIAVITTMLAERGA